MRVHRARITRLIRSGYWTRRGAVAAALYAAGVIVAFDLLAEPGSPTFAFVLLGLVVAASMLTWHLRSLRAQTAGSERLLHRLERDIIAAHGADDATARHVDWWELLADLDLPTHPPEDLDLVLQAIRVRHRPQMSPQDQTGDLGDDARAGRIEPFDQDLEPFEEDLSETAAFDQDIEDIEPDIEDIEPDDDLIDDQPGSWPPSRSPRREWSEPPAPARWLDQPTGAALGAAAAMIELVVIVDSGASSGQRIALRGIAERLAPHVPVLALVANAALWETPSRQRPSPGPGRRWQ